MQKNINDLQQIILEKIKKGEVKQKSRLFFIIQNILFWSFFVFFIIFGSISFASILYHISGNFKIIQNIFTKNFFFSEALLYNIPFFWLALLILFLYIAVSNYKKTKLFYRVHIYIIIFGSIIISFVLGSFMFHFGVAQKTEEFSEKYIPFYNKYVKIQKIKKSIFIQKLRKLGITQRILEDNPELKKKISNKFDKNVLGKIYLYKKPQVCFNNNFKCKSNELFFKDEKGCGCREVYFNLKK